MLSELLTSLRVETGTGKKRPGALRPFVLLSMIEVRLATRLASGACRPGSQARWRLCTHAAARSPFPSRRISTGEARRASLSESVAQEQRLPLFTVPSSHVQLIEHPADFYRHLLTIISRAQRRIFIASLYVGKTETELVSVTGG